MISANGTFADTELGAGFGAGFQIETSGHCHLLELTIFLDW